MTSPRPARRLFLKSAGAAIALPMLSSAPLTQAAGILEQPVAVASGTAARPRMVCIGNMLGFYPEAFWPTSAGSDYELSTTLQPLAPHRRNMTVVSGLDHGIKGGHFSIHAFLSGVRAVDAKAMPDGNITIDQYAAETVVGQNRFAALTVGSEDGIHGGCQMSWTRSGTRVPPIPGPRELFRKLFVSDEAANRAATADRIHVQGSILDSVAGDAHAFGQRLDARDRQKLDEYLTAVRDVEHQLQQHQKWNDIPKPAAPIPEPSNTDMVADLPLLYDLILLALATDSTRIATLEIAGGFEASAFGYRNGYHGLSHHGQVQESIDALIRIETYQVEQLSRFLTRLQATEDGERSLLDSTMVLFGSGMGNANAHTNSNLPVILAGGPFRHGQHLSFGGQDRQAPPLSNLFVSMLQQFGVETDRFATSSGTLTGLETKSLS